MNCCLFKAPVVEVDEHLFVAGQNKDKVFDETKLFNKAKPSRLLCPSLVAVTFWGESF